MKKNWKQTIFRLNISIYSHWKLEIFKSVFSHHQWSINIQIWHDFEQSWYCSWSSIDLRNYQIIIRWFCHDFSFEFFQHVTSLYRLYRFVRSLTFAHFHMKFAHLTKFLLHSNIIVSTTHIFMSKLLHNIAIRLFADDDDRSAIVNTFFFVIFSCCWCSSDRNTQKLFSFKEDRRCFINFSLLVEVDHRWSTVEDLVFNNSYCRCKRSQCAVIIVDFNEK